MSTSTQALRLVEDSTQTLGDRVNDRWESGFPGLPFEPSTIGQIPDRLDAMPPGPELGRLLDEIDVDDLSGYDRVVVLRAHDRLVSHHQAKRYDAMRAVRDAYGSAQDDPDSLESAADAAAEIRCALHLTRRAADAEMAFSLDLARRLPRVLAMLGAGAIDYRRARAIERGTMHLSTAVARAVVERIADAAPLMTTGEIAARIRKLCIEADPADAKRRYEAAADGRMITTEPTAEGTVNLNGENLPPHRVSAIARRINGIAKALRIGGETRTIDQIRADIYLDLLQGAEHATGKSTVHITADLDTLTALAEHPGELAGYGPVISDIARQVAEDHVEGEWRWTVTETATGEHLCEGTTRRRPSASQQRRVESRDRTCIYPGCRMPSSDCDIDHTVEYADGGSTCPCNTAPACRHDHRLKDIGWSYKREPNGVYVWTSPFGHTYSGWKAPP